MGVMYYSVDLAARATLRLVSLDEQAAVQVVRCFHHHNTEEDIED
jgi:hypothetical protein